MLNQVESFERHLSHNQLTFCVLASGSQSFGQRLSESVHTGHFSSGVATVHIIYISV